MQRSTHAGGALVLSDGGLASFVACAIEAERALRVGAGAPQDEYGGNKAGAKRASGCADDVRVIPVPLEHPDLACAMDAVGAQAGVLGFGIERADSALWDLLSRVEYPAGILLASAVELARSLGCCRVVWPAVSIGAAMSTGSRPGLGTGLGTGLATAGSQGGGARVSGEPDLDVLGAIADASLLATRQSFTAGVEAAEIRVEAPLADLSVAQILDLVEDFGLPRDVIWWERGKAHRDEIEAARRRWTPSVTRAGAV